MPVGPWLISGVCARSKCLYLCKCGVLLTFTWPQPTNMAPEVTRSQNHVTILASTACVEIFSSY